MKRPYLDEMKRLAELEKAVNPHSILTVELPDGRIKQVHALEYWDHRDEWAIHGDQAYGSELLFCMLVLLDQAYRDDKTRLDLKEDRDTILEMVFGKAISAKILNEERKDNEK